MLDRRFLDDLPLRRIPSEQDRRAGVIHLAGNPLCVPVDEPGAIYLARGKLVYPGSCRTADGQPPDCRHSLTPACPDQHDKEDIALAPNYRTTGDELGLQTMGTGQHQRPSSLGGDVRADETAGLKVPEDTTRSRTRDDRSVNAALSELRGLRERGQRPEPAWFHPFPARMPVSVAEYLITQITTSEAVILDPMVGSGTSLIAARRAGRHGIGFERDPLAVLIARSAISGFDSRRLEALGAQIYHDAQRAVRSGSRRLSRIRAEMLPEDRRFIDYWFPPESQEQLGVLADAIEEQAIGEEKDFAWVVFSSLIIAKSAGASSALDLPRSRPHKRSDKAVVLPLDAWTRKFRTAVARLPFKDLKLGTRSSVRSGDARELPLGKQTVDLVLTSPPYLNAIDYLRAHKFSLVWMGYSLGQLRELRGTMIGTERGLWSLDGLPPSLEERLEHLFEDERWRAIRRRYLSDLAKVLTEIARVLRPDGLALLALGPTIISSERMDAADVVAVLGDRVGLTVVAAVARQLRAAHRSLPPPHAALTSSPLSQRMRREVIVALRK